MSKLNRDVFYLIFKELQYDKKTLYSCISVNKLWCELIIPILWENPWNNVNKKSKKERKLLLNVIISCLSDELKDTLKKQGIRILYQRPLFDYISFCKHLNLNQIESIISINKKTKTSIIKDEIFKFFINENTNCTHLYITHPFRFQIHLFPGAKHCFSNLKFIHCNTCMNNDVLVGLSEICDSIKELRISIESKSDEYGIIKLIESLQKLYSVHILIRYDADEVFCKTLENSLIKHANTIQYFKTNKRPITKFLSSFVNLKGLELERCDTLGNVSLPFLQILHTKSVPIKALISLIESTGGFLIEVSIGYIYHEEIDNKRIIQAIYQKCPNLKYLRIMLENRNILELENLLINCQYLDGLHLIIIETFNWDELFKILTKSSPTSLFKFKFWFYNINMTFKLESLKFFFDNWEGRHSMLLQTISNGKNMETYFDLIEEYKTKGIVKKYYNDHDHYLWGYEFEEFEWIQKHSKFWGSPNKNSPL